MNIGRTKLFVVSVLFILGAGIGAFAISRNIFSTDTQVQAQNPPSETPVVRDAPPHPNVAVIMTAVAGDEAKPDFTGQVNGVVFIPQGSDMPPSGICTTGELVNLPASEVEQAVSDSDLDFDLDYLPPGYSLTRVSAVSCDGTVVSLGKAFAPAEVLNPVSITHGVGPMTLFASAPQDRIEPVTIQGEDGVLVKPIYQGDFTSIYIVSDDGTHWAISAPLPVDTVVKMAEEIR